jgi:2-polyprenyl-3-methyl-5-hydroxy-6-metoxy-1,4-benzoquinol methylase
VFRPAEVRAIYEEGAYEASHGEVYGDLESRRRDARVRLDWLGLAGRGRLLDVGAAGGAFVAEAAARGLRASGIEPTPAFARHAREVLGVDVREGTLESAGLDRYDVVTMWHVLEHIPDPLPQLQRVRAALDDGGLLALEVPNYGSVSATRMGRAWPSLEPEVHVNQFTPGSLRALLERAGFAGVEVETVPITPYLTWRARLGPRHVAARLKAIRGGHELLRGRAA